MTASNETVMALSEYVNLCGRVDHLLIQQREHQEVLRAITERLEWQDEMIQYAVERLAEILESLSVRAG